MRTIQYNCVLDEWRHLILTFNASDLHIFHLNSSNSIIPLAASGTGPTSYSKSENLGIVHTIWMLKVFQN